MSMQSRTADTFTRIRNALAARKKDVLVFNSKFNLALVELMKQEGYISKAEVANDDKFVLLQLKYFKGSPVIEMLKIVSKPSKRVYVKSDSIPVVYRGLGVSIISTSQGVMTDREARFKKLGGELVCQIL